MPKARARACVPHDGIDAERLCVISRPWSLRRDCAGVDAPAGEVLVFPHTGSVMPSLVKSEKSFPLPTGRAALQRRKTPSPTMR